jgi:hypothetical protein
MCKVTAFMEEIVLKHNNNRKHWEVIYNHLKLTKRHTVLPIESLFEDTLADVGGYSFVDEYGYDFDEPYFSDAKTATVLINSIKSGSKIIIVNSLECKIGSIRLAVYNEYSNDHSIAYFYLPHVEWKKVVERDFQISRPTMHRFRCSWSWINGYNWLEDYRVKDFVALARAKG